MNIDTWMSEILYKYLDATGGLMMLYYGTLQFTNATQLNDPFDCHPALIDFSQVPPEKTRAWPADVITLLESDRYRRYREMAYICSLSVKVARDRNPDIKIYQMTIDPDAFKLKEKFIND